MKDLITISDQGIALAVFMIIVWLTSLVFLLSFDILAMPKMLLLPAILLQTFLYTGLFITAHDAMHGIVAPRHKAVNNFIGTLCVLLYALFSFTRLRGKHHRHHAHPATREDPDFHDGIHRGFWSWYFHFMKTYVTWQQIAGMAIAFNVLLHLLRVPVANLVLFWILPALLSTLQLFYFGTYLPHREPEGGYDNPHHAKSNNFSVFWSFVTCYHFGYHWEHHEYPYVPWWRLPVVRRQTLQAKRI
ncbi:MAG: fatty acid desaturase [candidate division KSB1 bacterium]|nr:fatty acid desaturase [candidate division KSB1 bacterium]MDZ7304017.1 fatty acid desaturase [candidate division KSB1 bacterium]MDZ7313273.1 fatty acid desaturase [candidate division KSB1 bacterium]